MYNMNLIKVLLVLLPFIGTSQVLITIDNQSFTTGDTVDAKFKVYGFDNVYSYQFAMEYDTNTLELNKLELYYPYPMADLDDTVLVFPDGALSIDPCILGDFGFCKKGQIRHVWSGQGESCEDGSLAFTFSFIAEEDGALSESFNPASYILSPVSYTIAGNQITYVPLDIVYVTESISIITPDDNVQVYPNPVNNVLNVKGVNVEKVQIYNMFGQLTHEGTGNAEFRNLTEGLNFVLISSNQKNIVKIVTK